MPTSSLAPIHFVIPCYRASLTLKDCLESIYNLNYPKEYIHISVVENGVQEKKTKKILKSYPQVSYCYLKKKSRALARNYPIPTTKTDYIAYVDADVTLDKDWARHCLESIQGINIAAVGCSIYRTGQTLIDRARQENLNRICAHSNLLETMNKSLCLNTAATLIKTKHLLNIGMLDPSFARSEDSELTLRILSHGYHISSTILGKASVKRSDGLLAFFITTPFLVGYFSEKITKIYSEKRRGIMRSYWNLAKALIGFNWPNGFVVELIFGIQFIFRTFGTLAGRMRFYRQVKKNIITALPTTKFLSNKGFIYILNPSLVACLRKNDVILLVLNQEPLLSIVLKDEKAQTLRQAIRTGIANQNDALEEMLKESIILRID